MISIFRISPVDRVGTLSELRLLVENELEIIFDNGNNKSFALYKHEVIINIHNETFELFKLINKDDESLLIEAKDKILNKLVSTFNASKICLVTKLDDGFQKYEFIECENYNPPKKTWLGKLYNFLAEMNS